MSAPEKVPGTCVTCRLGSSHVQAYSIPAKKAHSGLKSYAALAS